MKQYWLKNKLLFGTVVVLCTVTALLSAAISILLKRVTDIALAGQMDQFWKVLIFAVGYMALICLANYLASLASKFLIQRMTRQMRSDVYDKIMSQYPGSFFKTNSADYLSILTNDVKLIEDNYILPIVTSLEMAVLFVATLVLLFFLSPFVAIVLIISLMVMFLVPALLGKVLEKKQNNVAVQLARFTEKVKDIFSGFEVIRSYRMFPKMREQFEEENKRTAECKLSADAVVALNSGLSDTLSYLSIVVVIFTSAYLVIKGGITIGTMMALIQLSGTFLTPVLMLTENLPKIKSVGPIIQRLSAFDSEQGARQLRGNSPHFDRTIAVKDVSFAYTEGNAVLNEVSLELEKGKKYAVVGRSGCGKSTLIRLLTGYYPHYDGQILYDGEELQSLCVEELGKLVSTIHQNIYLFNSTVRENIALYRDFPQKDWRQTLAESGVASFLPQLQAGLDSPVGENGNLLSGGQRQRVALARAFIRHAAFIVLDEGTSALDPKTAVEIETTLLKKENITLLTVTHSFHEELLREYDTIIFMEEGTVAAKGAFDELMNTCEHFRQFYGVKAPSVLVTEQ